MRIVIICFVAIIGAAACYLYYWDKKLEVVTKEPAARIVPHYFAPAPVTWPVRHLDIGYARFDVPEALANILVRAGDGPALKFVSLTNEPSQAIGFMMPPVSESGEDVDKLLKSFEPLADRKYDSVFELKKRALETQPPSVWSAVTSDGRKRMTRDLCLVVMKTMLAGEGEVQIAENDRVALIITERGSTTFFELHDKRSRHLQIMGFEKALPGVDRDELIASIFHTYTLLGSDFSEGSLKSALEKAGYPAAQRVP